MNEYVQRCTKLQQMLHERFAEIAQMEDALTEVRVESRVLQDNLSRMERRTRAPEQILFSPTPLLRLPTVPELRSRAQS